MDNRHTIYFHQVYDLLVELGGARETDREHFVRTFLDSSSANDTEWRFGGHFGHGGKFWQRSYYYTHDVTCYTEDLTPELENLLTEINTRLTALNRSLKS